MDSERLIGLLREHAEASREKGALPGERTLEDFPVGANVVVYTLAWDQHELRRGTVAEHSEYGFVVVELETKQRGRLGVPSSTRFSPESPGLLRISDVQRLRHAPERARRWSEDGGVYNARERPRLVSKLLGYTGYEGRPRGSSVNPPSRRSRKGFNRVR
ncbi:MAG TPA: hypothetical protein VIF43_01270 [Patescibacteria group bacterium]|jgi:hypothetical protein